MLFCPLNEKDRGFPKNRRIQISSQTWFCKFDLCAVNRWNLETTLHLLMFSLGCMCRVECCVVWCAYTDHHHLNETNPALPVYCSEQSTEELFLPEGVFWSGHRGDERVLTCMGITVGHQVRRCLRHLRIQTDCQCWTQTHSNNYCV